MAFILAQLQESKVFFPSSLRQVLDQRCRIRVADGGSPRYSRPMSSDKVPAELLQAVVEHFKPRRVILFGSRARGDARADSDYDLLVVVDDDFPREKLSGPQAMRPRGRYRGPVDILPMRHGVFEDRATIIGSLANTAEEEGVIVYERAQAAE